MKVISQVEAQRKIVKKRFPLRWSWPQANGTVRKLPSARPPAFT
ncbi:hypothetical protein ACNKHV_26720 [Shigella flexneri]